MDVPTGRGIRFRRMTDDDLDLLHGLLGHPVVMRHYGRPKSRAESQAWIDWNVRNYALDGFGLWIVETDDGDFVGDCGLTWQPIDGRSLELGYHVMPGLQGRGLGTRAATAAKNFARDRGISSVVAIIAPSNRPSIRVAEKTGLKFTGNQLYQDVEHAIYRADLTSPDGRRSDVRDSAAQEGPHDEPV